MADPLSILASIAGVVTAGVHISMALYDITHTIKRAPREVAEMAKELSVLSSILENMRVVIKQSSDLCKPQLINDTREVLNRITEVFISIKEMTQNSSSSMYRLKLFFRSQRTKALLAKVEGFKTTINLILGTLQLATLQDHVARSKSVRVDHNVMAVRQLVESLLLANRESITKLEFQEQREKISAVSNTTPRAIQTTEGDVPIQEKQRFMNWTEEEQEIERSQAFGREHAPRTESVFENVENKFQVAYRSSVPIDSATWLYYLVYPDSTPQVSSSELTVAARLSNFPNNDSEIEETVDRLVVHWTSSSMLTVSVEVSSTKSFHDPEDDWSAVVRDNVRRIEADGIAGMEATGDGNVKRGSPRAAGPNSSNYFAHYSSEETESGAEDYESGDHVGVGYGQWKRPRPRARQNGESRAERARTDRNRPVYDQAYPYPDVQDELLREAEWEGKRQATYEREIMEKKVELQKLREKIRQDEDDARRDEQEKRLKAQHELEMLKAEVKRQADDFKRKEEKERFLAENEKKAREAKAERDRIKLEIEMSEREKEEERKNLLRKVLSEEAAKKKDEEELRRKFKMEEKEQKRKTDEAEKFWRAKFTAEEAMRNAALTSHGREEEIDGDNRDEEGNSRALIRQVQVHFECSPDPSWDSALAFQDLGLKARFRVRNAARLPERNTTENSIIGTLLWMPPVLPGGSEMYKALTLKGWKPLWMRSSRFGETWFMGETPILMNFFDKRYKPQRNELPINYDSKKHSQDHEDSDDCIAVGAEWVEGEAIEILGIYPKGQSDGRYLFDMSLTYLDIENLMATSLLIPENRLRKACRSLPIPRVSTSGYPNSKPETRFTVAKGVEGEEDENIAGHDERRCLELPQQWRANKSSIKSAASISSTRSDDERIRVHRLI